MEMEYWGFLNGSASKESACDAGDTGSNPGLGRHPGKGNGNPPQYSCLKNSMDRGAWKDRVHGVDSAIKMNKFQSVVVRWMNLEPIIQSEISQKEKNKYCTLAHIYNLEKCH